MLRLGELCASAREGPPPGRCGGLGGCEGTRGSVRGHGRVCEGGGALRDGFGGASGEKGPGGARVSPALPTCALSSGSRIPPAGPGRALPGLGGAGRDLLSCGLRIPALDVNCLYLSGRGAMAAAARPELPQKDAEPPGAGGAGSGAWIRAWICLCWPGPQEKPLGWDIPEQSPGCWAQPPPFRGVGKGTDLLQDS